jgi:hypothetical protein
VEASRAAGDGKHLPRDSQGNVCPSTDNFPICCPCVQSGPTAKYMALRPGLNLVIAPRRLLPMWVKEWKDTVEHHSLLKMTLLLGHGTAIPGVKSVESFQQKELLMIAEAKRWAEARAWMKSEDLERHTERARALEAASIRTLVPFQRI